MNVSRVILLLPFLSLAACSRDAEVMEFVKENDETVKAVAAAADVPTARTAWDEHKESLKTKAKGMADIRGFQVKEETMSAMAESVTDGGMKICSIQIKHMSDADGGAGFKASCDEYTDGLKM